MSAVVATVTHPLSALAAQVGAPSVESAGWGERAVSFCGLFAMIGVAWVFSKNRRAVPWRVIGWGVSLQLVFGVLVLKVPLGRWTFDVLNDVLLTILDFTETGTRFVFGALMGTGFSMALNVLPTIVFFSSLMAVAYYLGIMQRVVQGLAWVMQRTMRTTGPESLVAAANIFVGQTEAPLVIRPFISRLSHSELLAVMTAGLATVSGGILAAYVGVLKGAFPDIAGHLLAASVMSAPASLVISKVLVPETAPRALADDPVKSLRAETEQQQQSLSDANVIDAAARGAAEGMKLALNVGAMLLAFIALVTMINYVLALPAFFHNGPIWQDTLEKLTSTRAAIPDGCDSPKGGSALATCIDQASAAMGAEAAGVWHPITLERVLGWVFWPFALIMGVPPSECSYAASLLGEKVVLNELVAYSHLGEALHGGMQLSYRSKVILSYALCGFANFGSIAILLGGIGGLAPERRHEISRLGMRALLGGTLAAFMTACVAGVLV